MKNILLVDDDLVLQSLLKSYLEAENFAVTLASNGEEALEKLQRITPDIILLDISMPKLNGVEMLKLRNDKTPVIVISSLDTEHERVNVFELGADDFLGKPFSQRELIVRIKAIQRRIELVRNESEVNDDLATDVLFDDSSYSVSITSKVVYFTQTEFKLFKYLFERKGRVIAKQELQLRVLQKELGQFDRNLDMHISNTRRKLAAIQLPKSLINTVRGKGYSFAEM
ncbi:response regulator transcription factor [Shewanella sp. KX20019]|uniref:response regulator transcription factor n=1 Tax=Shewanella sp. KX20019 TaxID=2803864 RepID=UPI001925287F|nr:response regulator transcription factor [Shewanella sp. KX20019]QQX82360.1 response regulator transcription factor [Shewanella sp. KX20019]